MNFLIKIEEAINQMLVRLLEKLKANIPPFVFVWINFIAHLPILLKEKYKTQHSKLRIIGLKFVGYTEHYTTMFRGKLTSVMIYFRSEEFKKADKFALVQLPFKYCKAHPKKAISCVLTVTALYGVGGVIYKNAEKIVVGTNALRKPASFESAEEDVFVEFKKHKFKIEMPTSGGAAGETHLADLYLDIKIEAQNPKEKAYLEHMEEMLGDNINALEPHVEKLPLSDENKKAIEKFMTLSLNGDFHRIGHDSPIKSIEVKQVLPGRPEYYRQTERMLSVTEINLQIFLEDTRRNRQVWVDFTVLASNRNAILYLKNHEVEFKDHLTTNVEPIIPQLPVEEEGRSIIKDKIKMELDEFLKKNGIEGKVLEIYIDYLIAS